MFNVPFGQFAMQSQVKGSAQQAPGVALGHRAESLRRVGYADGERQPRTPRHWANR